MDSVNKKRELGFPLIIDLSEMDEKSQRMILRALAVEMKSRRWTRRACPYRVPKDVQDNGSREVAVW